MHYRISIRKLGCPESRIAQSSGDSSASLKYLRRLNVRPQGADCVSDDLQTQAVLLIGGEFRVPCGVEYASRRDQAIPAHAFGYIEHRTDVRGRNAGSVQFFGDHCTAARAGASGGGQDDRLNSRFLEFPGYPSADSGCAFHCGGYACQREEPGMKGKLPCLF